MSTFQNKRNALLGGLLVFLVPILAVSVVYFSASRLPKGKEIPVLQNAKFIGDWQFINGVDTIQNGTFWKDVKVVLSVDSTNVINRVEMLHKITESTKDHPEFSLKNPYGQLYFIVRTNGVNPSTLKNQNNWFVVKEIINTPAFSNTDRLYLLDRDENIRGEYSFTPEEIKELDYDIQYLLQDTYYANADSLRIKTVFQTTLDEE